MKCAPQSGGGSGQDEAGDAQPTVRVRAIGGGQTSSQEDTDRGVADLRMIAVVLVLAWAFWQGIAS